MRRSLVLLALAGLLPVVGLSGAFGALTLVQERNRVGQEVSRHARFAATLVAQQLGSELRTLRLVADDPLLGGGKPVDAFPEAARRVLAAEPGWRTVSLATPGGQRLVDVPPHRRSPPRTGRRSRQPAAGGRERRAGGGRPHSGPARRLRFR